MEIEFETQEELYKRVLPALRSKVRELKNKGYDDIKDIIDMLCTLVPYRRTL